MIFSKEINGHEFVEYYTDVIETDINGIIIFTPMYYMCDKCIKCNYKRWINDSKQSRDPISCNEFLIKSIIE